MPFYVILVEYTAPLAEIDAALASHRAWVDQGFADGIFLLSGPRVPREGGAILAHGEARAALEARVAEDPFRKAGVARHQIVEIAPRGLDPRLEFLRGA